MKTKHDTTKAIDAENFFDCSAVHEMATANSVLTQQLNNLVELLNWTMASLALLGQQQLINHPSIDDPCPTTTGIPEHVI